MCVDCVSHRIWEGYNRQLYALFVILQLGTLTLIRCMPAVPQHSNFITIFQEQERPILCNGGYLVNGLFHLRLLGTLNLSLRDVILKGEQSVSNPLRSQEGAVMQVGSTFLWLVPCNRAEDTSAFLFLLVTILLALTVIGSM